MFRGEIIGDEGDSSDVGVPVGLETLPELNPTS